MRASSILSMITLATAVLALPLGTAVTQRSEEDGLDDFGAAVEALSRREALEPMSEKREPSEEDGLDDVGAAVEALSRRLEPVSEKREPSEEDGLDDVGAAVEALS